MKSTIKILALYFLINTPLFAKIEHVVNVCKEDSFLKCTNKNKQECENAFKLSDSYCEKRLDNYIDLNNMRDSMKTHAECINSSYVAYFDSEGKGLYSCLSKTDYMKTLEINMYVDVTIQAAKNLIEAPLSYMIELLTYYIITSLLIYLLFKKLIKKHNDLKSIVYRALIISIAISPTVMFGGEVAIFSPALFAIATSLIFEVVSISIQGIIIPMIFIFLIILAFLYLTSAKNNKNA